MRPTIAAALLSAILLLGCISMGGEVLGNSSNQSADNASAGAPEPQPQPPAENGTNATEAPPPPPPPPKLYDRYDGNGFSFEYPANMSVKLSSGGYGGIFSATSDIGGQTGEMVLATGVNTTAVFGKNREEIFRADPTKAASDFLQQDARDDPLGGVFEDAYETGPIKTFGIARDGFAAQAPFKIRFGGSNRTYFGHAVDIYVPERSLLMKARILALDSEKADAIRDNFLLSFRLS